MTSGVTFKAAGGLDEAVNRGNLEKDLKRHDQAAGSLVGNYTKALTTGETSNVTNRSNYYTAGGTIAAQTFALPAAPNDGDEVTILTSQVVTTATFSVASPGTATIIGAPAATAVNTPISFKYIASADKWYRI